MQAAMTLGLIVPENFIQATRDSGYKSLGSALAELIDNSFEAESSRVWISIEKSKGKDRDEVRVVVADNGKGMDGETLRNALRFGWSSRFNQRNSFGRYGMGLPNASLSHARRVDISSSTDGESVLTSYLDVDQVISDASDIAPTVKLPMAYFSQFCREGKGTAVVWSKCDRLTNRKLGPLTRRLREELGLLFRYQIWESKEIFVNGELVRAFDPMFVRKGDNLPGAQYFGPELVYEVEIPHQIPTKTAQVRVRFAELPIRDWSSMTNSEKNLRGIAKKAGVAVVRAGREIDHGWFFMGEKRKENYDDWWRCEVRFEPDLDELFGVTHTKQEIRPTEKLLSILVPDLQRIARELNGRARRTFTEVRVEVSRRASEQLAENRDRLLEPPNTNVPVRLRPRPLSRGDRGRIGGLAYRIRVEKLEGEELFVPKLEGATLNVMVNEAHPAFQATLNGELSGAQAADRRRRDFELLLLAAARSEVVLARNKRARPWMKKYRQIWSRTLATFLA